MPARSYLKSSLTTPQTSPLTPEQIPNNAGGYGFSITPFERLERFLILGSEGGTYYVSERKLTLDNIHCVRDCLNLDAIRTINTIASISENGRAPKNDPALYALAIAAAHADPAIRTLALSQLWRVARIGTHLFTFVDAVLQLRGWGRGLKTSIINWYLQKDAAHALVYDLVKYQSRNGWSHRDLLRLVHSRLERFSSDAKLAFEWTVKGTITSVLLSDQWPRYIWGMDLVKFADTDTVTAKIVRDFRLTFEMVPSEKRKSAKVWDALFENSPLTALIRNLGVMTANGLLTQHSTRTTDLREKLTNPAYIQRSRVHPLSILVAMLTYKQGHGTRTQSRANALTWTPVPQILEALDHAFDLSFANHEPTRKRLLLGVDVSGSMGSGLIAGLPGVTPRIAAAAMSLLTVRTEPLYSIYGFSDQFIPLDIRPRQSLTNVADYMQRIPFGATDCSLPIRYALDHGIVIDAFLVYTDSETWAGEMHVTQALAQYRRKINPRAKMIVVGFTATEISIADPADPNSLDVVGFDTASPSVINTFITGNADTITESSDSGSDVMPDE